MSVNLKRFAQYVKKHPQMGTGPKNIENNIHTLWSFKAKGQCSPHDWRCPLPERCNVVVVQFSSCSNEISLDRYLLWGYICSKSANCLLLSVPACTPTLTATAAAVNSESRRKKVLFFFSDAALTNDSTRWQLVFVLWAVTGEMASGPSNPPGISENQM